MNGISLEAIKSAHSDLEVAILQSLPSDDQIIMDHVRKASATLAAVLEAERS